MQLLYSKGPLQYSNSGSNIRPWIRRFRKLEDNGLKAVERSHTRFDGFSFRDTSRVSKLELPGKDVSEEE
ncbi:hypothetical protein VNO77_02035 [Canavalia gladiata]|uniref:Uncharacterized protein n=1 Tax=Canavalia gladiata TaxID=3824 RepID=A0AAN9RAW6_CANGL